MRNVTRHSLISILLASAVCCSCSGASAGRTDSAFDAFYEKKHHQCVELISNPKAPSLKLVDAYFDAARSNNYAYVDQAKGKLVRSMMDTSMDDVRIAVLASILSEVRAAAEIRKEWPEDLLEKYWTDLFSSLPERRSLVVVDSTKSWSMLALAALALKRNDVSIINLRDLCTRPSIQHLGVLHAGEQWLVTGEDLDESFSNLVTQVNTGEVTADFLSVQEGKVYPSVPSGTQYLCYDLLRKMHTKSAETTEFFFLGLPSDEFLLDRLVPAGLMHRISQVLVKSMSEVLIAKNSQTWDAIVKKVQSATSVTDCSVAREAYADLRKASVGLFLHHDQDGAAETALRQVVSLNPCDIDATFGLSDLLIKKGDSVRAGDVVIEYGMHVTMCEQNSDSRCDPKVQESLRQRQLIIEEALSSGEVVEMGRVFELAEIYFLQHNGLKFDRLVESAIKSGPMPGPAFWVLARICAQYDKQNLLVECAADRLKGHEDEIVTWLNLASAHILLGESDKAVSVLEAGVGIHGSIMQDMIADDPRFKNLPDPDRGKPNN